MYLVPWSLLELWGKGWPQRDDEVGDIESQDGFWDPGVAAIQLAGGSLTPLLTDSLSITCFLCYVTTKMSSCVYDMMETW